MSARLNFKPNARLYDLHPRLDDFRAEVLQGLSQPQKAIAPKFLYDKRGAELFDGICTLEEYYLTRTEMAILRNHAKEIASLMEDGVLIEFGSGSSQKVRILLDAMSQMQASRLPTSNLPTSNLSISNLSTSNLPTYIALDISKQHLQESCSDLIEAYPGLDAIAICADYTQLLQLPEISSIQHKPRIGFFPGSSIGNLEPDEAVQFLKNAATLLGSNGRLMIGVDLKKDKAILEPAYDDDQGISADFALNVLTRINRELGADFDLNSFSYQAFYNSVKGRIEMYIVSHKNQVVHLDGVQISFHQGERLRTEYSYKYSVAEFQALARLAGFQPKQVWTDPNQLFSLHDLELS